MAPPADEPLFALAERVAIEAKTLGIETAIIGGLALAEYNYIRATFDLDLATYVDPFTRLRELERRLRELGLATELREPDADDPLGGVLVVREREDSEPVEVVNFLNPLRLGVTPGRAAVENARPIPESPLRIADLPDLIALKVYASLGAVSSRDRDDVLRLLEANPSADLDAIREACDRSGLLADLEAILARRT
jgi:hypothetical protein